MIQSFSFCLVTHRSSKIQYPLFSTSIVIVLLRYVSEAKAWPIEYIISDRYNVIGVVVALGFWKRDSHKAFFAKIAARQVPFS